MITEGSQNTTVGEYVETQSSLIDNFVWKLQDKLMTFVDENGNPQLQLSSNNNGFYIQISDGAGGLQPPINIGDATNSNTVPSVPGDNFVEITPSLFRVVIGTILQMKIQAGQLYFKGSNLCFDNVSQNVNIKASMNSGQLVTVIDNDTSNVELSINKTELNVINKVILGVQSSINPNSAVNLSQLINQTYPHTQITDFDAGVQTNTIDSLAAAVGNVDLNNNKIINLADPINVQDAANKQYVDNTVSGAIGAHTHVHTDITDFDTGVQQNRIDQLLPPLTNLNLNNNKLINVINPTANQDAATKFYVDNQILTHTHLHTQIIDFDAGVQTNRLDQMATPTAQVSMGLQKLSNVANPTNAQDCATKSYVDSQISGHTHLHTDITDFDVGVQQNALNTLSVPISSVNLNSQKIINLSNPIAANDASNKAYVDSQIGSHTHLHTDITDFDAGVQTNRLDQLALPNFNINMNSQRLINVGIPVDSTDAVTKQYVDTNVGSHTHVHTDITDFDAGVQTNRLDQMAVPTTSISMNANRIISLAEPIANTDAATKQYVDNKVGAHTHVHTDITDFDAGVQTNRLDQMTAPASQINMNSNKIVNLANPTVAQDAATKSYVDNLVVGGHTHVHTDITDFDAGVQTNRLDQMSVPTTQLNLNNQKIVNLGIPTADFDASTKKYVDDQIGGIGVPSHALDSHTVPTTALNLNNQKIINLQTPTALLEAANKQYVDTVIDNLIDSAPITLNTLNELAAAIDNDPNFATTVANSLSAQKYWKDSTDTTNNPTTGLEYDKTKATSGLPDLSINGLVVGRGGGDFTENTAIGKSALKNNIVGIGVQGQQNTALGANALLNNIDGGVNTAIGEKSLYANLIGNNNTAVGSSAMRESTSGSKNVSVAVSSLHLNATGSFNTAIGYMSGTGTDDITIDLTNNPNANTDGTNNTFVGYQATGESSTQSNCITMGNSSVNKLRVPGVNFAITNGSVGVNIPGSGVTDASAIFEAQSTTKGVLFPRMTTLQRDNIVSPATGLTIYNISTGVLSVYDGLTWVESGAIPSLTLQNVYDNGLNGIIEMDVAKPIVIQDSLAAPVLTINETSVDITKDVNVLGTACINAGCVGVDNNKIILEGNVSGKSQIQSKNSLMIDMDGPAPINNIEFQTNSVPKFIVNKTKNDSLQPLDMTNFNINNLANPTTNLQAANKIYVDTGLSTKANISHTHIISDVTNLQTTLDSKYANTTTLNNITLANGNINANTNKITNVVNPTAAQDVATKNYVDTQVVAAGTPRLVQFQSTTARTTVGLQSGFSQFYASISNNITTDGTNFTFPTIGVYRVWAHLHLQNNGFYEAQLQTNASGSFVNSSWFPQYFFTTPSPASDVNSQTGAYMSSLVQTTVVNEQLRINIQSLDTGEVTTTNFNLFVGFERLV